MWDWLNSLVIASVLVGVGMSSRASGSARLLASRWKLLGWGAYTMLMISLTIQGIKLTLSEDAPSAQTTNFLIYANHVVQLVSLAGLWAYVFGVRIVSVGFWKVVFPVAVVAPTISIITMAWNGGSNVTSSADAVARPVMIAVISAGIWVVLFAPTLLALYRYAYRCGDLWEAGRTPASARDTIGPASQSRSRSLEIRYLICGGAAVGSTYALTSFVPRMFSSFLDISAIWLTTTLAFMMAWEKLRKAAPP
jgi:hypothetical protein